MTRHGVSTYDDAVTREVVGASVAGESLGAVAARLVGADVVAVDAGVLGDPVVGALACRPAGPRGDLVARDALSAADTHGWCRPAASGPRLGGHIVTPGEVGIGNTTVAAALVACRLGLAVDDAVGLGAGGDSATLERKRAVVADALARAAAAHGDLDDPLVALAALGGPEIAYLSAWCSGPRRPGRWWSSTAS